MSTTTDISRMSTDPGLMSFNFQTDLAGGLPEAERAPVWSLLQLLKVVAGSAEESAFAVSPVLDPERWRALEEADPAEIARAVARVEQRHSGWSLPGDALTPILQRLNDYFAAAERRARAVRR